MIPVERPGRQLAVVHELSLTRKEAVDHVPNRDASGLLPRRPASLKVVPLVEILGERPVRIVPRPEVAERSAIFLQLRPNLPSLDRVEKHKPPP